MSSWSRLAMARSGLGISATFASKAFSPAALSLFARSSAFISWARSFIAARSSAENPLDFLLLALADFCAVFCGLIGSAHLLDTDEVARGIPEGAVPHPPRLVG